MVKITNIEEAYNFLVVKDFWEQPSDEACKNIVIFLNEYIANNPKDARAYYLRSMAKFRQSDIVPNEYVISGKSCDKLLATITDDAFEDYNKAISIDSDIVNKNPNVRVIMTSCKTALKYYFRQPINNKILQELLGNNKWDKVANIIGKLFAVIFGIGIFVYTELHLKYVGFLCITIPLLVFLILYIYNRCCKNTINKLAKKYCEFVEPATREEIK